MVLLYGGFYHLWQGQECLTHLDYNWILETSFYLDEVEKIVYDIYYKHQ